ncbi:MAG: DUF2061 domain-containing protein [Neisseria sp.]|nr:DUF2061 domain-containing protein [Neisseria sp.]
MLKTLTFAILHFTTAFAVAYALTGNIGISSAVALVEPLANTVVFYFHEKVWRHFERRPSAAKHHTVCSEC